MSFRLARVVGVILKLWTYQDRINGVHHNQYPLQWHHNEHDCVSNHQPHDCLLKRLFRQISKRTSKPRVTGLCVGNSPGPVNSPHKWPVTRKMFPFDDVIMHVCLTMHQHPWYWLCKTCNFLSCTRKDLHYLCLASVEEWYINFRYILCFQRIV